MPIYEYSQNNSGGTFVHNEQVSARVLIIADTQQEANNVALGIGIYFDGVCAGLDCPCCGDRWHEPYEYTDKGTEAVIAEHLSGPIFSFYEGLYIYVYEQGAKVRSIPLVGGGTITWPHQTN